MINCPECGNYLRKGECACGYKQLKSPSVNDDQCSWRSNGRQCQIRGVIRREGSRKLCSYHDDVRNTPSIAGSIGEFQKWYNHSYPSPDPCPSETVCRGYKHKEKDWGGCQKCPIIPKPPIEKLYSRTQGKNS